MKKTCAQRRCIAVLGVVVAGVSLLCCPAAFALDPALDVSQYAHTAWKVRDGFPKGVVNSIAQTPDGYLWLGTEYGLVRFDGVHAVPWEPPGGQRLPSRNIQVLHAAGDGTLWIGTFKGLASWKGGKLTQYPELAGKAIFRLAEEHGGTVWAEGMYPPPSKLCAIRNGTARCYGEDGSLGAGGFSVYVDSKGNVWVGVLNGLWRWQPGPPQFYPVPGEANGIQGLAEAEDGALLIGTHNGIRRLVDGKIEAQPVAGPKGQLATPQLLRDRDGGLWIGTADRGLVHLHQGRSDEFAQVDGLSSNNVKAFFEDREGNIWVATADGLDRFREFAVSTLGVKQGLPGSFVGSVLADRDGSVWLGTTNGLYRWTNGAIGAFNKRDGRLNGRVPMSLFQDARGTVWASTHAERGDVGYLEKDNRFIPKGVPARTVFSFAEDTEGNLWMADQDTGLFRLSSQSEIEQIPWAKLGHKDPGHPLVVDPLKGGIWVGFFSGGISYFSDSRLRTSYMPSDGLGEGRVYDLRIERDGTLWAATEGGLSRLNNGRFNTLNSKNGLPCDSVLWVMEDDNHAFWLGTACGLVRIARAELDSWVTAIEKDENATPTIQTAVFDSSDGVRSRASVGGFRPLASKAADGRLWFSSSDGVSILDPRHLSFNKVPPPVHIEQIIADHKTYDTAFQLRLPPLIRDLEIDYTALSLVAPDKVRFRYKLEGLDSDWQDGGNRRQAFYTNLRPRHYRFRVTACNNSGVWNEAGTFLDFAVDPAYYQTWWFRLSLVAAFLALLVGLHRLRLRQLAQQFNRTMEARVGERTRIARELHDSLLQGVQGLMFRLQAAYDMLPRRPEEAREALEIALDRGDKAIAEARDTVTDLRQTAVGDSDIAKALTALGEELAAQSDNGAAQSGNNNVPCVCVLAEGKQRDLDPLLRDEIYRIAREALRNAFRHAKAQKIEVEIMYEDSEFLLHVRDDGSGIDPAVGNQGARAGHWGLPGMRERAKRFGGKLEVWSERGAGTEIELSVPAAIAYGKSGARPRFWSLRRKTDQTDRQQP